MSKIDLQQIGFTDSTSTLINANSAEIEVKSDTFLSRNGVTPNEMLADLDMNSNQILNLPAAVLSTEPVRKAEFDSAVLGAFSGIIGTSNIADNAVTTAKIPDGAITSAKILDLGIATGDIADNAITTAKIAAGNVTYAKLETTSQYLTNTRLAKTANYTVANADKGKTLALGGSAFYTLTLSAASGYDANFAIKIVNEDSLRAKDIAMNGVTTFRLYGGQSVIAYNQNNVWKTLGAPLRWKNVTGSGITFFVSTTGSDTLNDGLNASSPFATIQKAVNTHYFDIDHNNQGPTIQLADGTYIETVSIVRGPLVGYHFINFVGNTGTPANVIWEASPSGICLSARDYGIGVVSGMKFQAAAGGTTAGCIGLLASQWGNIDFSNVVFGAFPSGNQVMVQSGGGINPTGSYSITGGASAHMYCFGPGHILTSGGITVTISAVTYTSAFVQLAGPAGVVSIDPGLVFSGAGAGAGTTGIKFVVHPLADLQLNGVTLPGATAGLSGIGYYSGQGGTVTQSTNKSTAVTLNKPTGAITLNNAALAGDTTVSFTLNNTYIASSDQIVVSHESAGTLGSYLLNGRATGAGTGSIDVRNITTGSLSEGITIRFSIIKSVNG